MACVSNLNNDFSDDEIFMGPLTLMEVKRRLLPESYRQTIACPNSNQDSNTNSSLKLIEIHSMPDIAAQSDVSSPVRVQSVSSPSLSPEITSDWDLKPDDSFLKIEKMVSELTMTPKAKTCVVDFNTPAIKTILSNSRLQELKNDFNINIVVEGPISTHDQEQKSEEVTDKEFITPMKNVQRDVFLTPSSELLKTPIFKTPGNPVSLKKKILTPKRYQNVISPVATYIRKSPIVPLVKDVNAKKVLHGVSLIPKPVKHPPRPNIHNKENNKQEEPVNVVLPSVAYKSAKETKVIDLPDENKMPQNQWAKQVASSIPRALVLKHNHREMNTAKKHLHNNDSIGNLSIKQADLSICTQKSAFNKIK